MSVDKRIILRLRNGDEEAFNIIYHQYANLVFHVIYKIVGDKGNSEDLTQDTLIQMVNSIHTFNEKNNFKYWLLQIAKNKARDFMKKRKYVIVQEGFLNNTAISQISENNNDFDEMLDQYKEIITKEEFDIITLRLFHNMNFSEIGSINNKTESAVNYIYHRGIKKIKNHIKNNFNFLNFLLS